MRWHLSLRWEGKELGVGKKGKRGCAADSSVLWSSAPAVEDRATQRCDPSAVAGDRTVEGQGFGPALAFPAHPVVPNAINLPFVVAVCSRCVALFHGRHSPVHKVKLIPALVRCISSKL